MGSAPVHRERSAIKRTARTEHPNAVIRRYSQLPGKPTRVSDGRKIMVLGPQTLLASRELIDAANHKLASAGGPAGAYLRLEATDDTYSSGTMVGVRPVWRQERAIVGDSPAQEYRRSVKGRNAPSPEDMNNLKEFCTHADCHLTASAIMGSEDTLAGEGDTERPFTKNAGGTLRPLEPVAKSRVSSQGMRNPTHIANRGTYAFLLDAIPRFVELATAQYGPGAPDVGEAEKTAATSISEEFAKASTISDLKDRILGYMKVYRVILRNDVIRRLFATTFGVNEAAEPDVGDALMQINDEMEKQTRDKSIEDYNKALIDMMPRVSIFLKERFTGAAEKPLARKLATPQKKKARDRAAAAKAKKEAAQKLIALAARIDAAEKIKEESAKLAQYDSLRTELLKEPTVKEAFTDERALAEERPDEMWNFHWAGVVMRDGSDYVTLENLSTEFASDINTDWYFRMYGKQTDRPEQSFHEEAGSDSHVGDYPLTIPFRTSPPVPVGASAQIGEDQVRAFTAEQNRMLSSGQLYKLAKTKKLAPGGLYTPQMKKDIVDYVRSNAWIRPFIDPAAAATLELDGAEAGL